MPRVGVHIDARRRDSAPTLELLLEYWRFDRNFERNMDLLKFFLEVLPACVRACVRECVRVRVCVCALCA